MDVAPSVSLDSLDKSLQAGHLRRFPSYAGANVKRPHFAAIVEQSAEKNAAIQAAAGQQSDFTGRGPGSS